MGPMKQAWEEVRVLMITGIWHPVVVLWAAVQVALLFGALMSPTPLWVALLPTIVAASALAFCFLVLWFFYALDAAVDGQGT